VTAATRRGDREGRRRDILAAAATLLEAGGYESVNMREIARGAGVSAGTVYSYFQTKEHIFATLASEEFVRLSERVRAVDDPPRGFVDLLVELLPDFVRFHRLFGMHFSSWVKSKQRDAERAEEYMKPFGRRYIGMMTHLEQTLRKAADRDGCQLDDSELCMRLIWSTIVGLADEFAHNRHVAHSYDPDALSRYAARALLDALSR
jgi:AcrR family transcriptional regulator